jgi:hypothetical protein
MSEGMAAALIGAGCFTLGFALGRIREWYAQQASYRYARDVRRELDLFQAMRDAK